MVVVLLCAELEDGSRTLLERKGTWVDGFEAVERALGRFSLDLVLRKAFLLESMHREVDEKVVLTGSDLNDETLLEGKIILVLATPAVHLPRTTDAQQRQYVDECLSNRVSVSAVPEMLRKLGAASIGHHKVERHWREGLILKDLAFLSNSKTARSNGDMYLLHDLCPLSSDQRDNRKLGHLTAAYRGDDGIRKYHTLSTYVNLTSAGSEQNTELEKVVEYMQIL